jgi:GNAT superfamily N-acetyltransferase
MTQKKVFWIQCGAMEIHSVQTTRELAQFIQLPYDLYRDDPVWVPPLRDDVHGQFDPRRNPMLEHCDRELFLLRNGSSIIGRVAAFVDTLAVDFWKDKIGLFGYFECIQDPDAARALLDAARDWLQHRGMRLMRGPWTFVSQEWGMVVEGFSPSPVVMAPYNPQSYNDYLTAFGLRKVKDLLCWAISAEEGYQIPERILNLTEAVQSRYGIRIRPLNMQRFEDEVRLIEQLSNASIISNWGYSPVTEAEVRATARDLRPVIQPHAVLFAEDRNGRAIGFAIAIPDINHLLHGLDGRMLPFGWLKLLTGIPRLRRYRMFALGVIPEYQGKAVDSLIYRALYEALFSPKLWMEINYVLEDNYPMINAIKKLGAKPLRRYRVYEMEI